MGSRRKFLNAKGMTKVFCSLSVVPTMDFTSMTDRIEQFTHPAASPASNTQFDVLDAWRNDSTRYLAQVEFTGTPTRTFDSSSQSIIGDTTLSGNSADQSLTQSVIFLMQLHCLRL